MHQAQIWLLLSLLPEDAGIIVSYMNPELVVQPLAMFPVMI